MFKFVEIDSHIVNVSFAKRASGIFQAQGNVLVLVLSSPWIASFPLI
jgi:hypothetical protein